MVVFGIDGRDSWEMPHREVIWFERYCPPEPGMILADECHLDEGRRVLFVWTDRQRSFGSEICCWAEPDERLVAVP